MTPEAKAFRASTVQAIKARMQAPNYRILLQADTFDTDTDLPKVVFWRDMMLLGSVLLPEEPAPPEGGDPPAFYLDDAAVRAIIQVELDMPLRQFVRGVHVASWAFQLVLPGAPRGTSAIPRRFYTTSTDRGVRLRRPLRCLGSPTRTRRTAWLRWTPRSCRTSRT